MCAQPKNHSHRMQPSLALALDAALSEAAFDEYGHVTSGDYWIVSGLPIKAHIELGWLSPSTAANKLCQRRASEPLCQTAASVSFVFSALCDQSFPKKRSQLGELSRASNVYRGRAVIGCSSDRRTELQIRALSVGRWPEGLSSSRTLKKASIDHTGPHAVSCAHAVS